VINKKLFGMALIINALTNNTHADDLLTKADLSYGEYLSSECLTCHKIQGETTGIPSIVGLDAEILATLLHAYRSKELNNKAMQMVAGRLDNEQIASLSAYFASLTARN
jgi:cytochrome c